MKKLSKENIQENDQGKKGTYEKFINDQIILDLEIETLRIFNTIKFKNDFIEEKFKDHEKERDKLLKYFSDAVIVGGYLITLIYIIFAFFKIEILLICIICKLFSLFVIALSYINFFNNKFWLPKLEHLNVFSLSTSFVGKCFIVCFVYNTAEKDNDQEILRIIIYYFVSMNLLVFLKFEAKIFIYLFYFGINIVMIIICTVKSNKNHFYFLEGFTSLMLCLIFYAFRKVYDYLLRKNFAEHYKFQNYYHYTIEFIKGLNSLHVNYQNDSIKYIDPKFKNLLITLDNIENENKNNYLLINEFKNDQNYFYDKSKSINSNLPKIVDKLNENKPIAGSEIKNKSIINNPIQLSLSHSNNTFQEVDNFLNIKNINLEESRKKDIMHLSRFTENLILFKDDFSTNNTDRIILEEGLKNLFNDREKYYFNSNEDNNINLYSILNAIENKTNTSAEKKTDDCDKNFNRFKKLGIFYFKNEKLKKYFEVYYRMVDFKIKSSTIELNNNKNNNYHNPIKNSVQHDLLFYDVSELILSKKTIHENNLGKEKILAKIAHEFKTPITSIIGLVGSIKENLQNSIFMWNENKKQPNLLSENNTNFNSSESISYKNGCVKNINNISINNNNYYCGKFESSLKELKKNNYKNIEHINIIENLSKYVVFLISDIIQFANMNEISQINIYKTEIVLTQN